MSIHNRTANTRAMFVPRGAPARVAGPIARPLPTRPFASPVDAPGDPPFGGSCEGLDRTTFMREKELFLKPLT
jgi:hypothetical protein